MPRHNSRPTGPEDETPGAEFVLTRDQFERLCRVVPKKHGAIRLRDRGAAWVEVQTLDAEGAVTQSWTLPPLTPHVTERQRLRAIESGMAAKQYQTLRDADTPP
jgi:hypothetical protein